MIGKRKGDLRLGPSIKKIEFVCRLGDKEPDHLVFGNCGDWAKCTCTVRVQLQDNPVSVRKKLKLSFWNFSAHNSVDAGNFHLSNQALLFIDKVFTVVFIVGALFVGSDQYQYSGSY